jgi:hypothetical protein
MLFTSWGVGLGVAGVIVTVLVGPDPVDGDAVGPGWFEKGLQAATSKAMAASAAPAAKRPRRIGPRRGARKGARVDRVMVWRL